MTLVVSLSRLVRRSTTGTLPKWSRLTHPCSSFNSGNSLRRQHRQQQQQVAPWSLDPVCSSRGFFTTTSVTDHHHDPTTSSSADLGSAYNDSFCRARDSPADFWAEQAARIDWFSTWGQTLDNSNPPFTKWFVGGQLNACYNCVDRHVEQGWGDQVAIIHESPVTESLTKVTYSQLLDKVSRFARVLVQHGVKAGDRVLIYMPMIPEAMVAMLAATRIGAIHSLVFGGFASKQLSARIGHAKPKVIVSANCSIEGTKVINYKPLLDAAIDMADYKPGSCIIYNRHYEKFSPAEMVPGRDYCYEQEVAKAEPHDCVPVEANHPMYILYTSGTTGLPKAVVRPTGGHLVNLHWTMYNIYGVNPHETWFAASDLGWVVGHSYINYAPLVHCNTTVLFEGKPVGTPDAGVHFRILRDHNVVAMFVAPTAIRAIRREDPEGSMARKYKFPHFRYLFVAGEHCDWDTMDWAKHHYHTPVLDNWWQTETGSAITSTCVGLGNTLDPPHGVAGPPVPGWNVKVLKPDGKTETGDEELGEIVVQLPLPPGSFSTLWEDEQRYNQTYFTKFPGYYETSDSGYRDQHGNIAVMSRSDDVINVAGHRLSTGLLEEAILEHELLAECAVVGVPDKLKGHVPMALLVLQKGVDKTEKEITEEVILHVRHTIGPVASFKDAVVVPKLPKTRSGKIARNTIAAMLAGKPYQIPPSIEDEGVYPTIVELLQAAGYTTASLPPSL